MRASDQDRERVAKVLHDSMAEGRLTVTELEERLDKVYAAKTFADLEPITRDLPVANQPAPASADAIAQPQPRAVSNRVGGRATSTNAIAVMSGTDRKGVWTISPTFNAVAVMGGVEIDLTEAHFEDAETTIQAVALMGGVDIYVPEDVVVRVDGFGFMGAFENRVNEQGEAPAGAPMVRVTGLALMGGVEVKRRKRKKPDNGHRHLEH